MKRVRLNLYDVEDSLMETIELEVDDDKTYSPNEEIETPGGDLWVVAEVRDAANDQLELDARWFDGDSGSPYAERAQRGA